MLGVDTVDYADTGCAAKWAKFMVKSNLTVWGAWTEAGRKSFNGIQSPIKFAVWGHAGNFNDHITDYFNSSSGDIDYQTVQVHP